MFLAQRWRMLPSAPTLSLNLRTKKSRGASYEKCAVAYCRRKKLKIISKNLRIRKGEIDCLAWNSKNQKLILIEVRGRINSKYRPSRFIAPQKIKKLKELAVRLAYRHRCSVRIVLLEVIGDLPKDHLLWGLEWFPERLGLVLRDYEIE
jgi:Holliday junction resolvase-like predicted endonuclease